MRWAAMGLGDGMGTLATRIEAYRLGKEVPIAPRESPIAVGSISIAQPRYSMHSVIKKARSASHIAEMPAQRMYCVKAVWRR